MRLEALLVRGYRSIDHVEIEDCGPFNVLIGRNNSGKSNMLSAIDSFFNVLQQGELLTIKSPAAKVLDFHNRDLATPATVTVRFLLDVHSRTELLSNIVTEAPQLRNAVDSLRTFSRLSVTVAFAPPPKAFAYISTISLGDSPDSASKDRILLSVETQTAAELYQRASRADELARDSQALTSIPERVPKDYLRRSQEQKVPSRFFLREISPDVLDPAFERLVDALIKEAEAPEDFIRAARAQAAKWGEEISNIGNSPLASPLNTFAGVEASIPGYVSRLLQRLASIKILHLQERRKPIGREEAAQLLELKMSRGGPAVLRDLQETVSTLLGVQLDAFRSDASPSRNETIAEIDVDNVLVQVNGAGIREALRLVLDYEFLKPEILLIEEPEIHLHPGLETSMMRYLRKISADTQVFLTTHSTNFLDTAAMSNVYLISRKTSTQIQALDAEQAEARLPEELGLRMSSLFLYDRLVFVEGRTDEGILLEWASILGVNLGNANVGFVQMGGARTFAYYAAERTLSFLAKRNVKTWFLLDRDDRDDGEVKKLQNAYGQTASVTFLERREIENYLVSAPALTRFIAWKQSLGSLGTGGGVDEAAVQTAIVDCANELRDVALSKRVAKRACVPVYPALRQVTEEQDGVAVADRIGTEIERMIGELRTAKEAVARIVAEQTNVLNEQWSQAYVALVPGDLLLDGICRRFGTRFRKEKDGVRLASLMRADEIPAEVKTIIVAIGAESV